MKLKTLLIRHQYSTFKATVGKDDDVVLSGRILCDKINIRSTNHKLVPVGLYLKNTDLNMTAVIHNYTKQIFIIKNNEAHSTDIWLLNSSI